MNKKTVLITGCAKGYGLSLAKEYIKDGYYVYATARNIDSSAELRALEEKYTSNCRVLKLDVTMDKDIVNAADIVRDEHGKLDILINNACLFGKSEGLEHMEVDDMLLPYKVNTVGPLMMAKSFYPLLKNSISPKIVNVSSTWGSIWFKSDNKNGKNEGMYPYCATKAALNMVTRALAFEVEKDNIIVISIHPGGMGDSGGGPKNCQESAMGIKAVVDSLMMKDTSKFITWLGYEFPW